MRLQNVFEKFFNDIKFDRFCTCGSLVINISSLELLESQKPSFSILPALKVLNKSKKIKTIKKLLSFCKSITFQAIPTIFTEHEILSLPVPHRAGDNTDLPSNSNISKTVRVNIAFKDFHLRLFDKLSNNIQIDRLCTCASLFIDV